MNFRKLLSRLGGNIALCICATLVIALGVMLFWEWFEDFQTRKWAPISCQVLSSRVGNFARGNRTEFAPDVLYEYQFGDRTYRSRQYYLRRRFNGGEFSHRDYNTVENLVARFPAGSSRTCFVNPAHPDKVVLERRVGYTGLVMAFVVPGALVLIYGIFYFPRRPKPHVRPELSARPISNARPKTGKSIGLLTGVFLLAISTAFYFGLDRSKRLAVERTSHWRETPCTILSSTVDKQTQLHGSEFKANVLYVYTVNGREYRCNHFEAVDSGSSSYRHQIERARRFLAGNASVCFVNPNNPTEAVLNTRYEREYGFMYFASIAIFLAGLGCTVTGVAKYVAPNSWLAGWFDKDTGEAFFGTGASTVSDPQGCVIYRSTLGSPLRLAGLSLGVLIGAAVIGAVLWSKVKDWQIGVVQFSVVDFIVPLLGGVGIVWCVQQLWLGLAPQPTARVQPASVPPGGSFNLEWQFNGNLRRLHDVELFFEGREELEIEEPMTMHSPAQKKIFKRPFVRVPVPAAANDPANRSGSARVTVPVGAMHSFEAARCRIVWHLVIAGRLSGKTPVTHEIKVSVQP